MSKAPDAFRTISEVAEWLEKPTHVLRFWESKFPQVKPVKRAGGRRYYRPEDMQLLGGIKTLLHDDGMTIKGVQKLLREQGIKHVSAFSPPLDDAPLPPQLVQDEAAAALAEEASLPTAASCEDTVVPFHRETARKSAEPAQNDDQLQLFPLPEVTAPLSDPSPPASSAPAPEAQAEAGTSAAPTAEAEAEAEPEVEVEAAAGAAAHTAPPTAPLPDLPEIPNFDAITAAPGVLGRALQARPPLPATAQAGLHQALRDLQALRARMAAHEMAEKELQ